MFSFGVFPHLRAAPQLSLSNLPDTAFGGVWLVVIVIGVDVDAHRLVVSGRLLSCLPCSHEHVDLRFGRHHPADDVVHLGVSLELLGSASVPADDLGVRQVSERLVAVTAAVVLTFVAELAEAVRYERGAARGLLE